MSCYGLGMARLTPWLVLVCAGCSSDTWQVHDAKGRECTREVDNSETSLTCNATPQPSFQGCFPDAPNACFALLYNRMPDDTVHEQVCDACCPAGVDGGSPVYIPADCSDVTCSTSDDCAVGGAVCRSGICMQHP